MARPGARPVSGYFGPSNYLEVLGAYEWPHNCDSQPNTTPSSRLSQVTAGLSVNTEFGWKYPRPPGRSTDKPLKTWPLKCSELGSNYNGFAKLSTLDLIAGLEVPLTDSYLCLEVHIGFSRPLICSLFGSPASCPCTLNLPYAPLASSFERSRYLSNPSPS